MREAAGAARGPEIKTEQISEHVWQLSDILDYRSYLVLGSKRAVLVDSMGGIGDVRTAVQGLTDLPVTVLLTHRHYDHVGGSYLFDDVRISAEDDGHWNDAERHEGLVREQIEKEFGLADDAFWPVRDGSRPCCGHVAEGDAFDLGGGVTVETYALAGHTVGSLGFLVRPDRLLLSGDAVTPIMCLFFKESTGIERWMQTVEKMQQLDFDAFWTGHHHHAFKKPDLAGFLETGRYALEQPYGMDWVHGRLPEFTGTLYVPGGMLDKDPDSVDFRALIGPYVPRPPRHHRRRRRQDADA